MSRWKDAIIALWCEPQPTYIFAFDERFLTGYTPKSPLGFWRCVCIYEHGDVPEWVPEYFSTNHERMADALAMVSERGLNLEYGRCIADVLKIGVAEYSTKDDIELYPHWVFFPLVNATASQKATALCNMIKRE